jgi:Tfp pilus assembly protein PilO
MRIERDQVKTVVVLGAMAATFVLTIWLPDRLTAAHARQRMGEAQTELQGGDQAQQQLPALRREAADLQRQLDAAAKYVPAEPEMAQLMRELQDTLERHQARDINTRHGDEFRGANYNVIPITLQFHARFIDAFLFLEHIESMNRLVRIDKLDLIGERQSPGAPLEVTVQFSAFYAPQQEKQ